MCEFCAAAALVNESNAGKEFSCRNGTGAR